LFDRHLRPWIDPPLNRLAGRLASLGVGADALSVLGMALGALAGVLVALGWTLGALGLILASRLADGLDGAVARASGGGSDFGGYLDIVADFVFYAAVPLGFVIADPGTNGPAGAFLLAAFYVNGASFLGFATLAEKHRLTSQANGKKAFFHATGLLEGTETIALFVLICLVPAWFVPLSWGFGALCLLTAGLRLAEARARF
jgi:phosphatidylglycerophosphate synthase